MAPFKKSGGFRSNGGSGGFGGGDRPRFANKGFSRGGDRDRDARPPQLFTATCAQCHKPCEVPFRPNGERPVYCKDCFGSMRDTAPGDYGRRDTPERSFSKPAFQKRDAAPTYTPKPAADPRVSDLARQVESMSAKLDTLVRMVEGLTRTPAPATAPATVASPLTKVVKKIAKKAAKSKK